MRIPKTSSFAAFAHVSHIIAGSLVCLAIAGCTVGPNYHRPAVPTPPAYKEAAPTPASPPPPALDAWWKVFGDTTLDGLETQAVAANLDIKIALTHVDQADAARRVAHS